MIKKTHYPLYIVAFVLLFTACKNGNNPNASKPNQDTIINNDTLNTTESNAAEEKDIDTTEIIYQNPEVQEAHVAIVKEFGKQWGFCRCITKSDSVNAALMEASDEDFDNVKERSDFIDSKCKDMLIQPNSTPEDRMKHKQKVKNCQQQSQQNRAN